MDGKTQKGDRSTIRGVEPRVGLAPSSTPPIGPSPFPPSFSPPLYTFPPFFFHHPSPSSPLRLLSLLYFLPSSWLSFFSLSFPSSPSGPSPTAENKDRGLYMEARLGAHSTTTSFSPSHPCTITQPKKKYIKNVNKSNSSINTSTFVRDSSRGTSTSGCEEGIRS